MMINYQDQQKDLEWRKAVILRYAQHKKIDLVVKVHHRGVFLRAQASDQPRGGQPQNRLMLEG
jgi:hypothetical protein